MTGTKTFMSKVGAALGAWNGPRGGQAPLSEHRPFAEYMGSSMWAHSDGAYWGCPSASDKIAPGFYRPQFSQARGPMLVRMPISTDNLLRLPCATTEMLLAEFTEFWRAVPKLQERGLSPKRGLILWGPPGSGKTSAVQLMASHMVDELRGVVVMADAPTLTSACLTMLREIEDNRPLIVVYEDLDAMIERHGEAELLALLDGELQVPHVVNVATTNYPERLDRRFVDRPGRFDRISYVGMPNAEARRVYLAAKAPDVLDAERERWVVKSEGWSIAHLRELIVAHKALGDDVDETIVRLNDMREEPPSSEHGLDRRRAGFGLVAGSLGG